jgi:cellulose synthase/poly-beta-1,6-N-acetylglucosamine synthase-like glycosyltransferase
LGDSEGLYWKYESFIKSAESRLGSCTGVAGEILAVRRSLFEPAPETVICDDFHVAMRIARRGFRIAYAPRARSWERVSPSLNDERARRARIVAGRFQSMAMAPRLLSFRRPVLMWQLISHKFLRPLVPFAMLGALATNVALVVNPPSASATSMWILAPPFGAVLLLGQIAFYVLALLGGAAGGRGKRLKILFVPTFLVSSNAAAVVGLIRFARQHQHAAWTRVARRDGVAGSVPGADT